MEKKSIAAAILLVSVVLAVFTPAVILSSPSYSASTPMFPKTEDIFEGSFSPRDVSPIPNETFDVTFSICPTMDVPNTVIRFIMPADLIKLVKGDQVWTGDVKKGETVTLDLSLATNGEVEAYVRANVEASPSGVEYRSSYYLHVTTPEAKFTGKKEGSTKPVSPEADISPASNPESPRAPADPPSKDHKGPAQKDRENPGSSKSQAESPKSPGTIRIKGRFVYVNEVGGFSPARYMLVWLRDDDTGTDEWVAYQWTDADGNFDITTDNDDGIGQDGRDPYVQLWAEGGWDWISTTSGGDKYGWNNPKCGNDVDDGFFYDYGTRYPTSGNEALQAGDAVFVEANWIYWSSSPHWARPTKVTIRWPREEWPHCHGDYIDLPSKSVWAWDHVIVHHEYGHAVMWTLYGHWPAGWGPDPHYVFSESSGGFAMCEGWAEFMQCAVDNDATNLQDWYGGHGGNIETNDWYNCIDIGDMDGGIVEGSVASILWDIFDPKNTAEFYGTGIGDDMHWGFDEIFTVMRYDQPDNMDQFWTNWKARWPTLSTSVGPLCTIYWYYGIDKDAYSPWGTVTIDAGAVYTKQVSVTLTLSFYDYGSGVYYVRVRNTVDGPWSDWFSRRTSVDWLLYLTGDGTKYIYAQFKDKKGYLSDPCYDTIILDRYKPTGSIVINSGNPTYTTSTSVTLYLTYSDATSGVDKVRYGNLGHPWTAWQSPSATRAWTLPSGDGTKRVYYQIRDKAGWLSTEYYDEIVLDTVDPVTTVSHSPGSATVSLSATDATSGVFATYYRVDGGGWDTYTGPITLAGTGSHTIDYYSQDNAGNTEPTKRSMFHYLTVNTHPTGLDAPTGEGWYSEGWNATVSVSPVAGYTFEYWYLDGASGTPYSYDLTTTVTMVNPHTATAKFTIMCEITFYTDPKDVGSITFEGKTYTSGQKDTFPYDTSGPSTANAPVDWVFSHWRSTDNVSLSDQYDNPEDIAIRCGGTLTAVFRRPSKVVTTSFHARPGYFSPNGDGHKDNTAITATFTTEPDVQPTKTTEVTWVLRVKTAITYTVRTWVGRGGAFDIRWDGTDDAGKLLRDGEYDILLHGYDKDGNIVKMQSRTVIIDTVAPRIKSVIVSPDPFNPEIGPLTISYLISEKCHVTIKIRDSAGRTVGILRATQPAGANKVTWDGKSQGLIVPDGTYRYEIQLVDMAGNEATPVTGTITVKT